MAFKMAFCFQKTTKNCPVAGGEALKPPRPSAAGSTAYSPHSVMRLSYTSLLDANPALDVFAI